MSVPSEAFAASLAGFDAMTVHRLGALLRNRSPEEAFAVACGEVPVGGLVGRVLADPAVRRAWRASAVARHPERIWDQLGDLGVRVLVHGTPEYPHLLVGDPLPPPVLFVRGDLDALAGRRVAIVGTRNATAAGRAAARAFAGGLVSAGVHVVSGLARGVDGVAHREALAVGGPGRPIAVVASGHDVVYPTEHAGLWREVGERGVLLSEAPPGAPPLAHRFPLRNRIIAALSEVVVVVESRERGGSLITATEALDRGVPVMAVPGPAVNRAAAGTNGLLRDGAAPAVDVDDILLALSIEHRRAAPAEVRPPVRPSDRPVYGALGCQSLTVDGLVEACGLSLVEVAMSVARLEQAGWIAGADGWFEQVGAPWR
ncbi:MAG: DNA-processing protein DprA [Ilumatobacteraceae bacterium]